MLSLTAVSFAQIGISVRFGPPALPVYEQPACPGSGYLFTPGYWSWSDDGGYYWVPGTWVMAPVGLLWTPGYWGWNDGAYLWNAGYWGPTIGFYGGINYGFGYTGAGFYGGEWRGRSFFYNSAVMNVRGTRITNVYERTVVVNNSHVAFNGGEGGIEARPSAEQERYMHEHHTAAVAAQRQQERDASHNRALFASSNHGRPPIAATARPGDFKGHVVAAREAGGEYRAPAMTPREARAKAGENREAGRANEAEHKQAERSEARH
ncbi:MAG: YXWGXW repeat-containing protein, partial [Terriglobales bacterium]